MASDFENPSAQWRTYRKKLERNLFEMRWNQAKAISQHHTPRISKAEGPTLKTARSLPLPAPLKLHTTTKAALVTESLNKPQPSRSLVAVATPYRLPKLNDHAEFGRHRDYVFIQPLSASHFLIHKDPMRSTPVPQCVSPDLRIKPNSTKCRPLTQQRPKTKSPVKPWTSSGNAKSQSRFLPQIKRAAGLAILDTGGSKSPHTPPQSEVDFNYLPNVKPTFNERVSLPIPPTRGDIDKQQINWQLSPYSNRNFDRQGVGPNQGPFSREMPVKCTPPANWLRMKLRQRIAAGR